MADKIRGITIELGGDASGLEQSLKGVNKEIKGTQDQLKDVERLLKLDPKNTELLAQKQKLLGDQIKNTSSKLETLKKAQETMDKNGVDKNSAQYMALSREIEDTERNIKNLKSASEETGKAMSGVAQAADKIATGAAKVAEKTKAISGAAAGALTALAGLGIKAAKSADDLNTLSKQTGFSTAELQKFQYASDLVDVSMEDITGAATKLKKAVSSGSKELAALGVETKNADGSFRDISDIFYDTLDALGNIKNETERDAAAMAIFGKSADSLAGIVDDGGKSLKELGKEAEDLGLIMSQDTLDSLNDVNDEMDKLKAKTKLRLAETGAKAMQVLTPVLEKVLGLLDGLLNLIGSLTTEQLETIMVILAVIAAISPLASLISTISSMVAFMPTLITGVGTALTWLAANPIVLIIGLIVALVVLIATQGDKIKEIIGKVDDWLQNVFAKDWTEIFGPVLGGVLNGFFDVLSGIWEGVKGIFTGIIDFIQGVFSGDWQKAWEGVKSIFSGIVTTLVAIFKKPINGIITLINGAIKGINSLIDSINNGVGKTLGFSIGHIGTIPLLANGGILSKGSAIVGEAGPELLSVQNGKAVVQPLNNGAGGGATLPTTIVVQSVLDGRVIGESVTKYQGRQARAFG